MEIYVACLEMKVSECAFGDRKCVRLWSREMCWGEM